MCVLIYEELNHSAVHLKLTQHCKWTLCVCIFVLSPVWHLAIPLCKPAAHQSPLSSSIPQNLLKCMSTEPVMLFNNIILCFPFLLLPSVFPNIRSFPMSRFFLIRWPNYLSFSFSISPSNEYSGLISSRIDWLDLPAVQEMLNSLLQYHNSKTIISLVLSLLYESEYRNESKL